MAEPRRFFDFGLTFVSPAAMKRDRSTALVIVDMQYHDAAPGRGLCLALERIAPGSMAYFNNRLETLTVPTIAKLLAYFRAHELPVIHLVLGSEHRDLRDCPRRLREWVRRVEERSGVRDLYWAENPDFEIREELAPLSGETVVRKTTNGAFNGSDIERVLRQAGIESLVITGVATNACVETTARDAADRGYACVLVDEGTADYDAQAHRAALAGFYVNFGRVAASADEVIAALEAEASI